MVYKTQSIQNPYVVKIGIEIVSPSKESIFLGGFMKLLHSLSIYFAKTLTNLSLSSLNFRSAFLTLKTVFWMTVLFRTDTVLAQSYEVSCRAKAKEVAAETYRTCITENKQAHLQKIRSEYQQKLSELKNHYDGELKKLKSGTTSSAAAGATSAPLVANPEKNNKVKTRKSGARSAALPDKTIPTQRGSINTTPAKSNNDFEESSEDLQQSNSGSFSNEPHPYGDEPEVVEMPTETE